MVPKTWALDKETTLVSLKKCWLVSMVKVSLKVWILSTSGIRSVPNVVASILVQPQPIINTENIVTKAAGKTLLRTNDFLINKVVIWLFSKVGI